MVPRGVSYHFEMFSSEIETLESKVRKWPYSKVTENYASLPITCCSRCPPTLSRRTRQMSINNHNNNNNDNDTTTTTATATSTTNNNNDSKKDNIINFTNNNNTSARLPRRPTFPLVCVATWHRHVSGVAQGRAIAYMYIYIYSMYRRTSLFVYIYIYIERERERNSCIAYQDKTRQDSTGQYKHTIVPSAIVMYDLRCDVLSAQNGITREINNM